MPAACPITDAAIDLYSFMVQPTLHFAPPPSYTTRKIPEENKWCKKKTFSWSTSLCKRMSALTFFKACWISLLCFDIKKEIDWLWWRNWWIVPHKFHAKMQFRHIIPSFFNPKYYFNHAAAWNSCFWKHNKMNFYLLPGVRPTGLEKQQLSIQI